MGYRRPIRICGEIGVLLARNLVVLLTGLLCCHAALPERTPVSSAPITTAAAGIHVISPAGSADVEIVADNILHIDVRPDGRTSSRTPVLDPALKLAPVSGVAVQSDGASAVIRSGRMKITVKDGQDLSISVADASGKGLLEEDDVLANSQVHSVVFRHAADENLYGMRGIPRKDADATLLREKGAVVAAGEQGDGGAPFFFTTGYGVLIDSDGGKFSTSEGKITFSGCSREDTEYFVLLGPPLETMSALAHLTGLPPLPPKWTLGFLNGQWGSTEPEILHIASLYRQKHIPLDAFILDFDWKAWGEDNYGEWRWNSTSTAESAAPDKYPDGADGEFGQRLRAEGIRLVGILKPRILVYRKGSTNVMHVAAAWAQAHNFWCPNEPPYDDYVTDRPARDLDFSKPEVRSWFWEHLKPAFDTGIAGWWNDEADSTGLPDGSKFSFDNFQFLNMGRMLYEGQRRDSSLRVWSLNRNYYLGAQRYGYAEWSGDIDTGFASMQRQRARMLATLDLGEPHWSMDTGGFVGHPSPENYARWSEFAAFVPIDRVHGGWNEKRQPWVYGQRAEAVATAAIRFRYQLLPYIYSYERVATETGIGIVRPLFWIYPDCPETANDVSSWMFGDAFLVSPVVESGVASHNLWLPPGTWYDYFRGTRLAGGRTLSYPLIGDPWRDIPLFVRDGSIIASRKPEDYVDQTPATQIVLDVFPSSESAHFDYYDDDGTSWAYERGVYYRQPISISKKANIVTFIIEAPQGSFVPALKTYLVRIHGGGVTTVVLNGRRLPRSTQLNLSDAPSWAMSRDRFGPETILTLPARRPSTVVLVESAAGARPLRHPPSAAPAHLCRES